MKTCVTCNCYRPSEEASSTGQCRLFPPVPIFTEEDGIISIYPDVDAEDYCAQWDGEQPK